MASESIGERVPERTRPDDGAVRPEDGRLRPDDPAVPVLKNTTFSGRAVPLLGRERRRSREVAPLSSFTVQPRPAASGEISRVSSWP
jgi:hypothetical protein